MGYRMEPSLDPRRVLSPDDLRHAFEAAVCEIRQSEAGAAVKRLQYRAPIVPRAKVLGISQADVEKRALSDAARALARLWNV
jgi:hypothetical protein